MSALPDSLWLGHDTTKVAQLRADNARLRAENEAARDLVRRLCVSIEEEVFMQNIPDPVLEDAYAFLTARDGVERG